MMSERLFRCWILNYELRISENNPVSVAEEKQPTLKTTTQTQSRIVMISTFRIKYTRIALRKILKIMHKSSKGNWAQLS